MSLQDILHPKTATGTLLRDLLVVVLIVAVTGIGLFAISGTWPALIAVESGSMEPNMTTYSLVFVVDKNRFGGWQTQEEAITSGAELTFNGYGNVIVYRSNGMTGVTPIIHRAINRITAEEAVTDWGFTGDAAHAGVITKGDNPVTNFVPDQASYSKRYGRMQPVKEEWIVGKAVFAIPLIGWVPLNIIPSVLIAAVIVVIIEIVAHIISWRKKQASASRRDKRSQDFRDKKKE